MVSGHQAIGLLGIAPRPEGTLAEQFLHAEATNLQMSAGAGVIHSLAPGIHAFERGLDLSLANGERNSFSSLFFDSSSPQLAMAGLGRGFDPVQGKSSTRPRTPLKESIFAMSMGDPTDPPSPSRETGEDSALGSSRPEIAEILRKFPLTREGQELGSYRLFFEPFDGLLQRLASKGSSSAIAEREVNGVRQALTVSMESRISLGEKYGDMLVFHFAEAGEKGWAEVNFQPGKSIGIHKLVTHTKDPSEYKMHSGAGTMIMDWLATHAAREGIRFELYRVESPQIFRIVNRSRLLDPDLEKSWVEIHSYSGPVQHKGQLRIPIDDPDLVTHLEEDSPEHHTGMAIIYQVAVNVYGKPHSRLLQSEEEASELKVSRMIVSSTGEEHPFELLLPDLQEVQKAPAGKRYPIAIREGRTIFLQVRTQDRAEYMEAFVPDGMPRTVFDLIEGKGRGEMEVFWAPDSIRRHEINTLHSRHHEGASPLPPGAGTIITEWLATQAALNGMGFQVLQIVNPRILEILSKRNLMDLSATEVEIGYWNHFWYQLAAKEETTDFKNLERLQEILRQNPATGPENKFINVKGRPNPNLFPSQGKPPRR
jgi:hypothetical protein